MENLKNTLNKITLIVLLYVPLSVYAGGEKGDASHGIYCHKIDGDSIFTESRYYLLDAVDKKYLEERRDPNNVLMTHPNDVKENFKSMRAKLEVFLPSFMNMNRDLNFGDNISKGTPALATLKVTTLPKNIDFPDNCEKDNIVQIVTYNNGNYVYSSEIVGQIKHNYLEYSMLETHETLRVTDITTEKIILFNQILHSDVFNNPIYDLNTLSEDLYLKGFYSSGDEKVETFVKSIRNKSLEFTNSERVDFYISKIEELRDEESAKIFDLKNKVNSIKLYVESERCDATNIISKLLGEYIKDSKYLSYKGNESSYLNNKIDNLLNLGEETSLSLTGGNSIKAQSNLNYIKYNLDYDEKIHEYFSKSPMDNLKKELENVKKEYCN